MQGRIELIIGCMFAGKSTELLRRINRHELAGRKCLVVKPLCDTRSDGLWTHDHVKKNAIVADKLSDIDTPNCDVIGIDEIQFFDQPHIIEKWANCGLIVICAGLAATYQRRPWSIVTELVAISENITRLTAVCKGCGGDGAFTHRFAQDDKDLIGGGEAYDALCRKCWNDAHMK